MLGAPRLTSAERTGCFLPKLLVDQRSSRRLGRAGSPQMLIHRPGQASTCIPVLNPRILFQEKNVINLFLMLKRRQNFAKISFRAGQKDFRTPFDVIVIYTKQSTPLAVNNILK